MSWTEVWATVGRIEGGQKLGSDICKLMKYFQPPDRNWGKRNTHAETIIGDEPSYCFDVFLA